MHPEDPDAAKPQNGRGAPTRRRSFAELTEGWPETRRRRVRKIKAKQERETKAATGPALRWDNLAVIDLHLSKEDSHAVADALANPPAPNARLKKAAQRHRKLVAREDREEGA